MSAIATASVVTRLQNDPSYLRSFVANPAKTIGSHPQSSMLLASTPRQLQGASLEAKAPAAIAPTATAMRPVADGPVSSVIGQQHVTVVTSSVLPPQHQAVSSVMPQQMVVSSALPQQMLAR